MQRAPALLFAGLAGALGGAVTLAGDCPAAPRRVVLADAVRGEALPAIASAERLGLGVEARAVAAWAGTDGALVLDGARLRSGPRELRLSPRMASSLAHLQQFYALAPATLARPIAHAELTRGALQPAAVARISTLFEGLVRTGVRVDGRFIVPETGGEAALDAELRLRAAPDPRWVLAREISRLLDAPAALRSLCEVRAGDLARLDPAGVLRAALAHAKPGDERGVASVRLAAATVVENAATAYVLEPEDQLALVAAHDWCGRYVGRWHTHPPHDAGDGWTPGAEPSFDDLQNAVRDGQFLTLAFHPDGFDLYDAAALSAAGRADLSLLKVTRYRAAPWRRRFQGLHDDLRRSAR